MNTMINNFMALSMSAFRIGAVLYAMPVIGTTNVTPFLRFILSISIAYIFFGQALSFPSEIWTNNYVLLMTLGREIAIGLWMGFTVRLLFLVVNMGLEFAGMQMGFTMANIFDPQNNSQVSVLSYIGLILGILLFFGSNFHYDLLMAIKRSYQVMPMGLPDWKLSGMMDLMMQMVQTCFVYALKIAMPVMAGMFFIQFILGVIARTAPQMNLFFNITFILNIVAGLFIVVLSLDKIIPYLNRYNDMLISHGYGIW
ncbi:flagellar biosynthetic protein FliR [bacterium]|nr:flagellar biosynthetic protein FliR [bacterium]